MQEEMAQPQELNQSYQQMPFVKQLAASDRPSRDKAVASLRTFLGANRQFEEIELLKLWKGLFFCMWMSDRPRPQQRLAVDLANLVEVLPDGNVFPFLQAFWKTMAREWNGIDVLRMNKFLLLVRRFLFASFTYLRKQNWEVELVKQHNALLESIPLHPSDMKIPNGMRYHVIDIYVDEMDRIDEQRSDELPLDLLLEPLRRIREGSPTKTVRARAQEALDDERLKSWSSSEVQVTGKARPDDGIEEDDDEWQGFDD